MTGSKSSRRSMVGAATAGLLAGSLPAGSPGRAQGRIAEGAILSAAAFGAVGDGTTDDTAALQAALDAAFSPSGPKFLAIPPGTYRITRTLRLATRPGAAGDITRNHGILAHGARIASAIANGGNVFEVISNSTVRFLLIEGLDILGAGREGHGLYLECETNEHFLYNLCLRDVTVQGCGGDGCRMIGNIFEGQVINTYLRDNQKNGLTLGHGERAGILSAMHVFGSVFGQNGQYGAALINKCYDIAFHGCYFLLNGKHGLAALNGCSLLSNCGFENNHLSAATFAKGGPGILLHNFGTLIGCMSYSIMRQKCLVEAYIVNEFAMIGCYGSGDDEAKEAGLAYLGGPTSGHAVVISCRGRIDYAASYEALEIAINGKRGIRFGSAWHSRILPQLGDYTMWVDQRGKLRLKKGTPTSDEDGHLAGG